MNSKGKQEACTSRPVSLILKKVKKWKKKIPYPPVYQDPQQIEWVLPLLMSK